MIELVKNLGLMPNVSTKDEIYLTAEKRGVCRQRLTSKKGEDVGLFLERGHQLTAGEILQSEDGSYTVKVCEADEEVVVASAKDPLLFAKSCYHLGNRHVPLQIDPCELSFTPDKVLEELCVKLGLEVRHQIRPFHPESGAYAHHHEHSHDHHHDHDHELSHEHSHHIHLQHEHTHDSNNTITNIITKL